GPGQEVTGNWSANRYPVSPRHRRPRTGTSTPTKPRTPKPRRPQAAKTSSSLPGSDVSLRDSGQVAERDRHGSRLRLNPFSIRKNKDNHQIPSSHQLRSAG